MAQPRKKRVLEDVKKARRRRTLYATAILGAMMVAIIIGAILLSSHQGSTGLIGTQIGPALYNDFGVSSSTLAAIGTSQGSAPSPISGQPLVFNGKPEVLYVGAEYCPYCAAERWSIIVALSKFGTFTGLTYMLSGDSPEPFPNTPTFSFTHASYASSFISFVSVETQDRNHGTLQTVTTDQQNLLNSYDSSGAIPFLDMGNRYAYTGSQFPPSVLVGLNWTQIGSQLNDANSPVAKSVDGVANTLITAICKIDSGQPSGICSQSFANLFMPPPNIPITDNFSNVIGACAQPSCRRPVLSFS